MTRRVMASPQMTLASSTSPPAPSFSIPSLSPAGTAPPVAPSPRAEASMSTASLPGSLSEIPLSTSNYAVSGGGHLLLRSPQLAGLLTSDPKLHLHRQHRHQRRRPLVTAGKPPPQSKLTFFIGNTATGDGGAIWNRLNLALTTSTLCWKLREPRRRHLPISETALTVDRGHFSLIEPGHPP